MKPSIKTSLIRNLTLAAGALVITTMTFVSAADAKPKFNIQLNFGGSGHSGGHGGHGHGHAHGWTGPSCSYYWYKYQKTGKWFWKAKYYKCKGYYY